MRPVQTRGSWEQSPATLSLGSETRTRCRFAWPLVSLLRSARMSYVLRHMPKSSASLESREVSAEHLH